MTLPCQHPEVTANGDCLTCGLPVPQHPSQWIDTRSHYAAPEPRISVREILNHICIMLLALIAAFALTAVNVILGGDADIWLPLFVSLAVIGFLWWQYRRRA